MKPLVRTLVLALATLVAANFAVAASKFVPGTGTVDTAAGPAEDVTMAEYQLARQLNPRLEFAQWSPAVSWICQTPTFWCRMVAPDYVGDACYCATAYGPVAGFVR